MAEDVRVDFAGRGMLAADNVAYEMSFQHVRPTTYGRTSFE